MYESIDRGTTPNSRSAARRLAQLDIEGTARRAPGSEFAAAQNSRLARTIAELNVSLIARWLWRGRGWILATAIAGVVVGYAFGNLSTPRFTTYADMLIAPTDLQITDDDLFAQAALRDAQLLTVESKMRLLTSGNVLRRVVEDLQLQDDPDFVRPDGPLAMVAQLLSGAAEPGDPSLTALRELDKRVAARREERSFVVTLSAWDSTPEKAVILNNAIVSAFQAELSSNDANLAGRAGDSLAMRLDELKASVNAAEERVETFRRQNGLQANAGELLNSQSMAQLNTELSTARTRLIQARSRYGELVAAQASGRLDPSMTSETTTALRTQYAALKQELDSSAAVLGPKHPTIQRLQPQVVALAREIDAEVSRLVNSAYIELEEAQTSLVALETEVNRSRTMVSVDNAAQVELRQLERDAQAQAAIYEAFLARSGQVAERSQIDSTNVRVISRAVPPEARNWPPRSAILMLAGGALGVALGALLAGGLAFRRHYLNQDLA